jgi:uncharacterized membrane protein
MIAGISTAESAMIPFPLKLAMVVTFLGVVITLRLHIIPAFVGWVGTWTALTLLLGVLAVGYGLRIRDHYRLDPADHRERR